MECTVGSENDPETFSQAKDLQGNIERHKARLVATGFSQREGINYIDTFSPVSKKKSLYTITALVAHFDFELHQMDMKTTFANKDIEEKPTVVMGKDWTAAMEGCLSLAAPKGAGSPCPAVVLTAGCTVAALDGRRCTTAAGGQVTAVAAPSGHQPPMLSP
ncbi:PREDICTED: uncharacterized protein LOC109335522 [Lupinus angustifolius]|uniref:uncharacterized protein LOC109335522 n=1 Tax=Lupinus angustifolius TaxID=3871 RepID=UPI00092F59E1|nr:PREDICTED: uncharacterized protein LOC109335522 [Lupinus angustifolius]